MGRRHGIYFRMSPEFRLSLQRSCDLETAARAKSRTIAARVSPWPALALA